MCAERALLSPSLFAVFSMQGQLKLTCLFMLFFVYSVFDVTGVFAVAGAKCVQRALLSPSLFAVFQCRDS